MKLRFLLGITQMAACFLSRYVCMLMAVILRICWCVEHCTVGSTLAVVVRASALMHACFFPIMLLLLAPLMVSNVGPAVLNVCGLQRMGRGGRGMPRMGPYDMAYPPPPGPMMMGGRGPPDGFRPRYSGGRGGRGGQWGGPDRFRGPQGRGPQGRGRGGPAAQQAVPAPPPPPPAAAAPAAAAAAPMAASGVVPGQQGSQLTTAMLAAAPPEQQKQMLGERLFPLVQQLQPVLAGKITGMLLEMDNSELLLLLESSDALTLKTDEAISVLKQHNALPEEVNLPADGDIE